MDLGTGLIRAHLWVPANETGALDAGELPEAFVGDRRGVDLHPLAAESGLVAVDDEADADVVVVPVRWSQLSPPGRAAVRARPEGGPPLLVWSDGDLALDVPRPDVVVVQNASHRSRGVARRVTAPTWFGDLQRDVLGGEPEWREADRPLVGFCGQVAAHPAVRARALAAEVARRSRRLGGGAWGPEPEPLRSHLVLRRRTLAALEAHPGVATRFVRRDRYGVGGGRDRAAGRGHDARQEFVDNLAGTDYTVCVRGQGNFSVRLYEALCCGRVPVVVDTDCLLPWPDDPFWREVALVVPATELDRLGDRLVAHHAALTGAGGLAAAQQRARRFWEERISRVGFLRHLAPALRPAVGAAGRVRA